MHINYLQIEMSCDPFLLINFWFGVCFLFYWIRLYKTYYISCLPLLVLNESLGKDLLAKNVCVFVVNIQQYELLQVAVVLNL